MWYGNSDRGSHGGIQNGAFRYHSWDYSGSIWTPKKTDASFDNQEGTFLEQYDRVHLWQTGSLFSKNTFETVTKTTAFSDYGQPAYDVTTKSYIYSGSNIIGQTFNATRPSLSTFGIAVPDEEHDNVDHSSLASSITASLVGCTDSGFTGSIKSITIPIDAWLSTDDHGMTWIDFNYNGLTVGGKYAVLFSPSPTTANIAVNYSVDGYKDGNMVLLSSDQNHILPDYIYQSRDLVFYAKMYTNDTAFDGNTYPYSVSASPTELAGEKIGQKFIATRPWLDLVNFTVSSSTWGVELPKGNSWVATLQNASGTLATAKYTFCRPYSSTCGRVEFMFDYNGLVKDQPYEIVVSRGSGTGNINILATTDSGSADYYRGTNCYAFTLASGTRTDISNEDLVFRLQIANNDDDRVTCTISSTHNIYATDPGPFLLAGADGHTTLDLTNIIVQDHVPVVVDPRTGPDTYRVDNDGMIYWYNPNGDGLTYTIGFIFTNKTKHNVVDGNIVPLAIGYFIDNNENHKFDTNLQDYQDGAWGDRMFPTWWLSNSLNYSVIRGMAVEDAWIAYKTGTLENAQYWVQTAVNTAVGIGLMRLGGGWGVVVGLLFGVVQWALNSIQGLSNEQALERETAHDIHRSNVPLANNPYPCIPMRIQGQSGFVTLAMPKMSFELTKSYSNSAAMETGTYPQFIYESGFLNIAEGVGVTYNNYVIEDLADVVHLKLLVQYIEDTTLEANLWEKGVSAEYLRHVMFGWFAGAEIPDCEADIKSQKGVNALVVPSITSSGKVFYIYMEPQGGQYLPGLYTHPLPKAYGDWPVESRWKWDANNPWPDPISRSEYVDASGKKYYGVYGFNDFVQIPIQIDPMTLLSYDTCCLASAYQTGLVEESQFQARILMDNMIIAAAQFVIQLVLGLYMQGTFSQIADKIHVLNAFEDTYMPLGVDWYPGMPSTNSLIFEARLKCFGEQLITQAIVQPAFALGVETVWSLGEIAWFHGDTGAIEQYHATFAGSMELSAKHFWGNQLGFLAYLMVNHYQTRNLRPKARETTSLQDELEVIADNLDSQDLSENEVDARILALAFQRPLRLAEDIDIGTRLYRAMTKARLCIDLIQDTAQAILDNGILNHFDAIMSTKAFVHDNGVDYSDQAHDIISSYLQHTVETIGAMQDASVDLLFRLPGLTRLLANVEKYCRSETAGDNNQLLPRECHLQGYILFANGKVMTFAEAETKGWSTESVLGSPLVVKIAFVDPRSISSDLRISTNQFIRGRTSVNNIYEITTVTPEFFPEDVELPPGITHIVSAYRGKTGDLFTDLVQVEQKYNIERDPDTEAFQGNGLRFPVGLIPLPINYVFDRIGDTGTYQLKNNIKTLLMQSRGQLPVFGDGSVMYFKGGSGANIENILYRYFYRYGLTISKNGDIFTLRLGSLAQLCEQGARFVIPDVSGEVLDNLHAGEILARHPIFTIDDLTRMVMYGAIETGRGIFIGSTSKKFVIGTQGGEGQALKTNILIDQLNLPRSQITFPATSVYAGMPEGPELSIEPFKTFVGVDGRDICEIDDLVGAQKWIRIIGSDGVAHIVERYGAAVAHNVKFGVLNYGMMDGIYDNLFNTIACKDEQILKEDGSSALNGYIFSISNQQNKKMAGNWQLLLDELMTGKRQDTTGFIFCDAGEFVAVDTSVRASENIVVGVFKMKSGEFVRYELQLISAEPKQLMFRIRSEVGAIDETKGYGDATHEPTWLGGKPVFDTWDSQQIFVLAQDLPSYWETHDLLGDINIMLGGGVPEPITRFAIENMKAGSHLSEAANEFLLNTVGLDNENNKHVQNGALMRLGIVVTALGLMQDDRFGAGFDAAFLDRLFGGYIGSAGSKSSNVFKIALADSSLELFKFDYVFKGKFFQAKGTFFTQGDKAVQDEMQAVGQDIVNKRDEVSLGFAEEMVGNYLSNALPVNEAGNVDTKWHRTVTIDRIVEKWQGIYASLKGSELLPVGILDGLDSIHDTASIVQTLEEGLSALTIGNDVDIVQKVKGKTGYYFTDEGSQILALWMAAWETLIRTSIATGGALTGELNVLTGDVFGLLKDQYFRVKELSNALMKASFIGYWSSAKVTMNDIIPTPTSRMQFEVARLNCKFDLIGPGCVLGADGYYYARIRWLYMPSDGIRPEFIIRFSPSGDLNAYGYQVYAVYTPVDIPGVASANHFYSSIGMINDVWNSIVSGSIPALPDPLNFQPGMNLFQMWELVEATEPFNT